MGNTMLFFGQCGILARTNDKWFYMTLTSTAWRELRSEVTIDSSGDAHVNKDTYFLLPQLPVV